MRLRLGVVLLGLAHAVLAKPIFHYTLNYHHDDINTSELTITLQFKNNANGIMLLSIPEQAQNFRAASPHTQYVHADNNDWVISEPGAIVSVKYNIEFHNDHGLKPIAQDKLFVFVGERAFVVPKESTDARCRLTWHLPNDYQAINSFGAKEFDQQFDIELHQLTDALFVGTSLPVQHNRSANKDFYFISDIANEEMMKWVEQIVIHQQQEFGELSRQQIAALIRIPGCLQGGACNAATALNNALYFAVPADFDTELENSFALKRVIAHENMHHWIGRMLSPTKPQELRWFIEGFTEFFAIDQLAKAQHIQFDEYKRYYNYIYREYTKNPFHQVPYDQISGYFEQEPLLEMLPYYQGFLFAHFLQDQAYQSGRADLYAWLKSVLAANQPIEWRKEALFHSLEGYFPEVALHWHQFFNMGQPVPLVAQLVGQPVEHTQKTVQNSNYAFDMPSLLLHKIGVSKTHDPQNILIAGRMIDSVLLPESMGDPISVRIHDQHGVHSHTLVAQAQELIVPQLS